MKPNAKHKMDSRQIVPCLIVLSFIFVCFLGFFVFVFVFFGFFFHFIRRSVDQTGS